MVVATYPRGFMAHRCNRLCIYGLVRKCRVYCVSPLTCSLVISSVEMPSIIAVALAAFPFPFPFPFPLPFFLPFGCVQGEQRTVTLDHLIGLKCHSKST